MPINFSLQKRVSWNKWHKTTEYKWKLQWQWCPVNENETLELFDGSDFSFTNTKQFEEQNDVTNAKNDDQYDSITVDNTVDHCDNPTILNNELSKVNSHIVYYNTDLDTWGKALVNSRAGKVPGRNKDWLNIKKLTPMNIQV